VCALQAITQLQQHTPTWLESVTFIRDIYLNGDVQQVPVMR